MEDGEHGQTREHAALLDYARTLLICDWERGRDEVQVFVVARVQLLYRDELAVLRLHRLAEVQPDAIGHNEPFEALAALAVEPILETLLVKKKKGLNVIVA